MKRRYWLHLIVVILLVGGILAACGGATETSGYKPTSDEKNRPSSGMTAATAVEAQPEAEYALGAVPGADTTNAPNQQAVEQLIIKTATVEGQTDYDNLATINQMVTNLTNRLGGYIVSTNDASTSNKNNASVTVAFRVPVAKFDEALNSLASDTLKITRREISGDDVTAEFVDNESRLRNLEATSARLRELLAKATTVTEAVEVNRTLSDYESQIEVLKGRQKYLKDSAAMSLITLTVRSNYVPTTTDNSWSLTRSFKNAWVGLLEFGQGLADLLIALLVWSPIWLPVVLFVWWIGRKVRRATKPQQKVVVMHDKPEDSAQSA